MLRVTTLHASSAAATAAYYAKYLSDAPGEVPGRWSGRQADRFGLGGDVTVEQLELLLSGRDPQTGTLLGRELLDRYTANGREVRAVSGFDATFSASKSLSVVWALTGDHRLLQAHDTAVAAAMAHLERFGSTTRVRSAGGRLHPDTQGLTIASFRQTTSRADDPQIHTHAVVSSKVQTLDGRWLALDGRYLKRHQRMLGGLYQSVLRAELTVTFGVEWRPIVNGQAEIAGIPVELLERFSKRSREIDVALAVKLDEFRQREGRAPSRWERAALTREASADSRRRKNGHGPADLADTWRAEAAEVGWTATRLWDTIRQPDRPHDDGRAGSLRVADVVEALSAEHSTWGRADAVRTICDMQRPIAGVDGRRWAALVEEAADRVIEACVDLDPTTNPTNDPTAGPPPGPTVDPAAGPARRSSDGRSLWIEPTAPRYTSDLVLAQEEAIISWVLDAHSNEHEPSRTIDRGVLDVLQVDAAASVAGADRVALVVGPAGAGKTLMLAAAVDDLERRGRAVFGLAPSAKAARILEQDTGMPSDTVAKLLYEWSRPERPPTDRYRLPADATVVVDEAGMLGTPALHRLVGLAGQQRWRLALIGDPLQLQAVGRGGLFNELCTVGRVVELERLHRFTHEWEAAASLRLRHGDPSVLDDYEDHGRIIAGSLDAHLDHIATSWITAHQRGDTVALVATTNEHVDTINHTVQQRRLDTGQLDDRRAVAVAGGESVYVGDVIATRRNDRRLVTSERQAVRNRDLWTVNAIGRDGSLAVTHNKGHGTVTLPVDYIAEHVRLGYAATEHGYQGDTVTTAISLATTATTRRGLYVAATRGRDNNTICVVTDSDNPTEARDTLETILASDRADIPAVTQRRTLAQQAGIQPVQQPQADSRRRAVIPSWFGALVAETRTELDAAHRQLRRDQVEQQQINRRIATAAGELAAAARDAAPAFGSVSDARREVDHATERVAAAEQQLSSARRRRRPAAQRSLDDARANLNAVTRQLVDVERVAAPATRRWHAACRERDAADSARDVHHLDNILKPPERTIARLQQRLDSLDTWHDWANGTDLDPQQLRGPTALDRADANQADPRLEQLAATVRQWAVEHGVDLSTDIRQRRQRSIDLEL